METRRPSFQVLEINPEVAAEDVAQYEADEFFARYGVALPPPLSIKYNFPVQIAFSAGHERCELCEGGRAGKRCTRGCDNEVHKVFEGKRYRIELNCYVKRGHEHFMHLIDGDRVCSVSVQDYPWLAATHRIM